MTEVVTEIVDGTEDARGDEAAELAVSPEELAGLMEARRATYELLSRLYLREIDGQTLSALRAARFPANTGNVAADEGYRAIATYLSRAGGQALEDLALDFARCFIGEGMDQFSAAYPYESVHTTQQRLLMQSATNEVAGLMASEGVEKRAGFNEPEDHIAIELEFMGVLAGRTAEALREGADDEARRLVEVQRAFHEDHLASWVPLLTEQLRSFAQTDLYRGLASLTDGFLAEEQGFFDGLSL